MATILSMLTEAVKLHQAGDFQQAERIYREVLCIDPNQGDALNLLAVIANHFGKPEAAIDLGLRAIAAQPHEPEFHGTLAAAYKATGDVAAAVKHYREAIRLKPQAVSFRVYLCDTLLEQGQLDEALALCQETLRLDPSSALAWCVLGELVGQGCHIFTDADIAHMQRLVADGRLPIHDASMVHFTLAAHWEKNGAHDEAFRAYQVANDLKREVYRQSGQSFDQAKHRDLIDRLIAFFTPEFFERVEAFGADTEMPIFVVGMVRSGTSLVEQILGSLPRVFGAGELKDLDQLSGALPEQLNVRDSYPACLDHIDPATARKLAYAYLQRHAGPCGASVRMIDKMPHNYLHLGLIAVLFPRARIIHCRRDPMDTCAAAYFQNFKWLPYTASLDDIVFYYRQHERLIAHWERVLPLRMHEVVYEEMVANQEAVSRDLVAFSGLSWNDDCLAFYNSRRTVQTASKLQVRQPIYTRSVARWQRFASHLEPLRQALGSSAPSNPAQRRERL